MNGEKQAEAVHKDQTLGLYFGTYSKTILFRIFTRVGLPCTLMTTKQARSVVIFSSTHKYI